MARDRLQQPEAPPARRLAGQLRGAEIRRAGERRAEEVRHAVAPTISSLPTGSLLVIRALGQEGDSNIETEISELIAKLISRSEKVAAK